MHLRTPNLSRPQSIRSGKCFIPSVRCTVAAQLDGSQGRLRRGGVRLARGWLDRVVDPFAISKLAKMLADPFYVGEVEWNGVRYPGNHKALVSRTIFEKVQEVLRSHNRAGVRQRTHDHYLKDFCIAGSAEGGSRSP